jgi:hypothetical protein
MARDDGITWAPDVTCYLPQRYLIGDSVWLEHVDAGSLEWLGKQDAEAPIAWLRIEDATYPDGWRAVPVAALGEQRDALALGA